MSDRSPNNTAILIWICKNIFGKLTGSRGRRYRRAKSTIEAIRHLSVRLFGEFAASDPSAARYARGLSSEKFNNICIGIESSSAYCATNPSDIPPPTGAILVLYEAGTASIPPPHPHRTVNYLL